MCAATNSLISEIDDELGGSDWTILVCPNSNLTRDEIAKIEWEASEALRSEFGEFGTYAAYRRAEAAGLIKRDPPDLQPATNRNARENFGNSLILRKLQSGEKVAEVLRGGRVAGEEIKIRNDFWEHSTYSIIRNPPTLAEYPMGETPKHYADPAIKGVLRRQMAIEIPDDELAAFIHEVSPTPMPGISEVEPALRPLIRVCFGGPASSEQLRRVLERSEFAAKPRPRGRPRGR